MLSPTSSPSLSRFPAFPLLARAHLSLLHLHLHLHFPSLCPRNELHPQVGRVRAESCLGDSIPSLSLSLLLFVSRGFCLSSPSYSYVHAECAARNSLPQWIYRVSESSLNVCVSRRSPERKGEGTDGRTEERANNSWKERVYARDLTPRARAPSDQRPSQSRAESSRVKMELLNASRPHGSDTTFLL